LLWVALRAVPGPSADQAFLNKAALAKRHHDAAGVTRALRAWATVAERADAKTAASVGLEAEAAEAIAWGKSAGRFELFITRLPDRVRVGVSDPAELLGRLDAFVDLKSERIRLRRLEDERQGRFEYGVDAALSTDREIVIEAVALGFGGEIVLKRVVLSGAASEGVPKAPDPKVLADRTLTWRQRQAPPEPVEPVTSEPFPWWILAAGAVAAILVGAAVWQETRY
jgi:hypothetical protein